MRRTADGSAVVLWATHDNRVAVQLLLYPRDWRLARYVLHRAARWCEWRVGPLRILLMPRWPVGL